MSNRAALQAVIRIEGSQAALARALDLKSRQVVGGWMRNGVPPKWVIALAKRYPSVRWPELSGVKGDAA